MSTISAYPLSWPLRRTRSPERHRSRFGKNWGDKPSVHHATVQLLQELERAGVDTRDTIISTNLQLRLDGRPRSNQRDPEDPGVAVYFELAKEPHVLACDRWDRVGCNLLAIAKHVEALRGQERWGVGSLREAFTGYRALPEHSVVTTRSWQEVLGLAGESAPPTADRVRQAYRALVKLRHPDAPGGSESAMVELTRARDRALDELAP